MQTRTQAQVIEIELDRLAAHPLNSNRMPAELFEKLCAEIGASGRYPPVIVRAISAASFCEDADAAQKPALKGRAWEGKGRVCEGEGRACEVFQILDGHHRVAALRRLGRATARCVVWDADDAEALALLAMLNRLQGRDDPKKRAALVGALAEAQRGAADADAALARLPETRAELERLMALSRPPEAGPSALGRPRPLEEMPVSVHFFLMPAEARRVEARLAAMGGGREEALMRLVVQELRQD